jgi:hypothetical protein
MDRMHAWTWWSIGVVAIAVAAGAVWVIGFARSPADPGSISQQWIIEHRKDPE